MTLLTDKDLDTEVWRKLKAHYISRKQSLLEKLAGDMTHEETVRLRGKVQECNQFLRLEEREPEDQQHIEF
jgi:hypothetical protein